MDEQKKLANVFNPVKEERGDEASKRAIWSTQSIELALKARERGQRLIANPFYDNNVKLLKADLTFRRTEEEINEWKKCKNDILYFVEHYCKIMTPTGVQLVALRPYQLKYLEHLQKHRMSIMRAARQSGKTVTSALFMLHFICFNIDKAALIVADKYKTAREILKKTKDIYLELPYFLKPGIQKWNESEISLDNGCLINAESTTGQSGIGFTYHCVLSDEFAHLPPNIAEEFYGNLLPVVSAANARFMITSTQNGRNLFYRLFMGALEGVNDYAPFTVDWPDVPSWNPDKMCWEKRDEAWKIRQVANLGGEKEFNKQYGVNFDLGTNTLINQKTLYNIQPICFEEKSLPGVACFDCWVWRPEYEPMDELRREHLVITADLAEQTGNDNTVFSIYRLIKENTLQLLGYFKDNKHSREDTVRSLMLLMEKYTNPSRVLLSFERNTYGDMFINNIYKLEDIITGWDRSCLVKYYSDSGSSWKFGIKITSGNKTPHCILFKESLEAGNIIIDDEKALFELQNFADDGTGHYKASFGHDDMVMTAVQTEFVKETLQYKLLLEDYMSGASSINNDNIYNPYDTPIYDMNIVDLNYKYRLR